MGMNRVRRSLRSIGFLALAVAGLASEAAAGIITVPPSLGPGDSYRLVFITSTTDSASSSTISDYNSFAATAADSVTALMDLPATWSAIVSTSTESALSNIGGASDVPIFLLDGDEAAAGTASLFSGTLLNPIDIDENGKALPGGSKVWTGSNADGSAATGYLGSSDPEYGIDSDTSSLWIADGTSVSNSVGHNLYVISSVLTIAGTQQNDPGGASIPEPSTIGLAALGGAVLLLARRRAKASA
jgi:hypothetical protein